jgi:hypothetical protein
MKIDVDVKRAGHPRFYELLDELAQTHHVKSLGYDGNEKPYSNFRGSEELGVEPWRGALLRMRDKWQRILSLVRGGIDTLNGESLRDTLIDLASYALCVVILLEEAQRKIQPGPKPYVNDNTKIWQQPPGAIDDYGSPS